MLLDSVAPSDSDLLVRLYTILISAMVILIIVVLGLKNFENI
ncbi:hypothetical protein ABIA48_004773 [Pseudomonas sp. S30_BP2TU TE3576]